MANTPKETVRFYTRSKKPPIHEWRQLSYCVVVGYDHKRITIPGGHYTPAIWYDEFSQLNSDGTPKNPETASKEVLDVSKRLVEARQYYETALALIIQNGLWADMDANGFKGFLFYHFPPNRLKTNPKTTNNNPKTTKTPINMELNEYQQAALTTAVYPEDKRIVYPALGMCGEAGEVAEKVKKVIRDNDQQFTDDKKREIAKEIGDVLWYCATLSNDIGYTLEDVARMNIEKLQSRQQRGRLGGSGDNR